MKRVGAVAGVLLLAACASRPASSPQQPTASLPTTTEIATCEAAFAAWVGRTAAVNTPGANVIDIFVSAKEAERRVFELCSLDEAERHNREIQIHDAPGMTRSLIEPDIRTFADVECVDDEELIGGTPLCAELGH